MEIVNSFTLCQVIFYFIYFVAINEPELFFFRNTYQLIRNKYYIAVKPNRENIIPKMNLCRYL